jgi:hypothetical protein
MMRLIRRTSVLSDSEITVDQLVGLDPGHHRAQLLADDLDLVLGVIRRRRDSSVGAPARFSRMKLLAYSPVWMSLSTCASRLGVSLGDDLRAGHVLAVLGVVGDRVVHVGDAAFVDQVDDQLELVQALEVGHLGRVAGLDQRLEAP